MWEVKDIKKLEAEVGQVRTTLAYDRNHKSGDIIANGVTYKNLIDLLERMGNYIDSELFLQGE